MAIEWEQRRGSSLIKGQGGLGPTFRAFQICDRSGGEIFGDCPRGMPWELYASGGGRAAEASYHAGLDAAKLAAEQELARAAFLADDPIG